MATFHCELPIVYWLLPINLHLSLSIQLFGPFTVTEGENDSPLAFRTDALRALLAILALERGKPLRREALASLLAPDRPDKEALTYLRNRLTRLRKTIGDDKADPPYLEINRKEILLNEQVAVDVAEFERLLNEVNGHAHREVSGCPSCIEKLTQAAGLYKGELLAGFNLENDVWQGWLTTQRERVKVEVLDLLEKLGDIELRRSNWERVVEIGRQQIELDKWREPAYRSLMRASFAMGDRAAALGWYETCEKILYEELGTDPDEDTLALQAEIASGEGLDAEPFSAAASHNLPAQVSPFFGRQAEKEQLIELLVDPNHRLVTIVGEGGVGKTRLSLEVGQSLLGSFPDGVWFVPLAEANEGMERLKIAVGEAIGLGDGTKQLSGDQVLAILREKRLLLIFDNSEYALDEIAFIPEWLRRAPDIAILASSREPLNFGMETVVQISGLPLGKPTLAEAGAAIRLFEERGQRARPDFALTEDNVGLARQVCEMVGGSPLAIGLAAAWLRRRPLQKVVESIIDTEKSLDFLTNRMRDAEPRHRSMRAVFEGSWAILEPEERAIFASLSVFPSSFSEDAAEAVAGASIFDLDILAEKSILQQQLDQERYLMHSLLRQFAIEKQIEAAGKEAIKLSERKYIDYFYDFAKSHSRDHILLGPEWDNMSIGISRAYHHQLWSAVLNFVHVLDEPWFRQARFADMREALGLATNAARMLGEVDLLAKNMLRLGEVEIEQSKYERASEIVNQSLELFYQLEDGYGIAHAQYCLGRIDLELGKYETALAYFQSYQTICEQMDDRDGVANSLILQAYFHLFSNQNYAETIHLGEQALEILKDVGNELGQSRALRLLSITYFEADDYDEAQRLCEIALDASRSTYDRGEYASILYLLTCIHRIKGNVDKALEFGLDCLDLFKQMGLFRWEGLIVFQLARIKKELNGVEQAIKLCVDSIEIMADVGAIREEGYAHLFLAQLYSELDLQLEAEKTLRKAIVCAETIQEKALYAEASRLLSEHNPS